MGLFGPSKAEIWQRIARETGGTYTARSLWKEDRVQIPVSPWTITLDSYTIHAGHMHIAYTRLRAPFVNPEGFRFKIYRKGVFSELGKLFGMQHIEVDDIEISERFILQGNDEWKFRELVGDPTIAALVIKHLKKSSLEVKDKEGWPISRYPAETDLLYYCTQGIVRDVDQLRGLIDLFAAIFARLEQMGATVREDPGVAI